MIPIIVASTKGGVCKSMTVRSLADAFAELGHTVVVMDADPQQSLTWAVGMDYGMDPWNDDELIAVNGGTRFAWWLRRGGAALKSGSAGQLESLFERLTRIQGADVLLVDTGAFEPHIVRAAIGVIARLGRGMVLSPIRPNSDDIPGYAGVRSLVRGTSPQPPLRGLLSDVERIYSETRAVREKLGADYPGEFIDVEIPHDARAKDATGWSKTSALTNDPAGRSRAAAAYRSLASVLCRELGI